MYILRCPECESENIYLSGEIKKDDGTADDIFMCEACDTEFAFSEAGWVER